MERVTVHLAEEIVAGLVEEAKHLGCSPQALLNALTRHGLAALSFSPENVLSTPSRREAVAGDAQGFESGIEGALTSGRLPKEAVGRPGPLGSGGGRPDARDPRRTYSRTSRARFGPQTLKNQPYEEEIYVSLREGEGSDETSGEFAVRWYLLGRSALHARVECFDENVGDLLSCQDLLKAMSDAAAGGLGPDDFEAMLHKLGFEDEDPSC